MKMENKEERLERRYEEKAKVVNILLEHTDLNKDEKLMINELIGIYHDLVEERTLKEVIKVIDDVYHCGIPTKEYLKSKIKEK